ncbi:alpha/beta hydrolase [Tamlana sp. 2_MG-2023]|uniref:alpha/beta hydrolase n=1 Tax=unclassified Tamlana TaxID=2614803 RepID=UPI0026E3A182|nr:MULTISPECIES: alpha/beta hydrolase [unclassified Tamlana]MDO6758927.1 alpha/beta hydrolase [Tamlana sp. 2_MG-2023]MDO6789626.1 alpha/beta hydrolase [Tamlana sp. 1_MG-2023]
MKSFIPLIIFLISFSFQGCAQKQNFSKVKYPEGYKAQIDVVYTKVNGWEGRIDLYTNPKATQPTPIVINIHGGGWNHGNKESQTAYGSFFKNGYAVANVEYRLTNVAPAPAAIEDVRCALIYIHKNAKSLNVDPSKIVVMGGSAGAHLALMTGLLGNDTTFDSNCKYSGNIKVAAIIDKYAPTDLTILHKVGSSKEWLSGNYLDRDFVASVSPLYYITKDSPPIIIVHGDKDPTVPYSQSVKLYKKLQENHVKSEFITIKNGKHGGFSKSQKTYFTKKLWVFLKELGLTNE